MLSKEYNPEVLKLPSWVTLIFDTVLLLSLQALDLRTKSFISDAPSRPARTNASCAANPYGAPLGAVVWKGSVGLHACGGPQKKGVYNAYPRRLGLHR